MSGKKILILEKDQSGGRAIGRYVSYLGYSPSVVSDEEEAYRASVRERPELIIINLTMPGRGSYNFARKLKENPITAHIPLVLQTPLDMEGSFPEELFSRVIPQMRSGELGRTLKELLAA